MNATTQQKFALLALEGLASKFVRQSYGQHQKIRGAVEAIEENGGLDQRSQADLKAVILDLRCVASDLAEAMEMVTQEFPFLEDAEPTGYLEANYDTFAVDFGGPF